MADLKSLLKEARKLIDEKKFNDAQECCKNILRQDKQNYFGLVLLGKSLQDSDQAALAYQKAIASKRDQPLAWQGLANYYERKEDMASKQKLFGIYSEMLYLQLEEDKISEIISKVGLLGISLKESEAINILINFISKSKNNKVTSIAEKHLLECLNSEVPCKNENFSQVLELCKKIYLESPNEKLELIQCKLILQTCELNVAVPEIIKLQFFIKSNIKEFLCKFLCLKYVEKMSFNGINIEEYMSIITENMNNSKYPDLLRSMISYENGLYLEAYKQCVPLVNYNEADPTESIFITNCTMKLNKWPVTQKLAINFITKAKDEKLVRLLRKMLFISLAKQRKWKQAIANANLIPFEELDVEDKTCLAECLIEENEPADHVLEVLKNTEYFLQLKVLMLLKQHKYSEVVDLLAHTPENALYAFYLGKTYWELKDFNNSLVNLLKAAKLNPDHAETFLYLGHFYCYHKQELGKAKKCYEKAYHLNNISDDIIKSLSNIYIKLLQPEANFKLLLSSITNINTVEPWVHYRVGLHYLKNRDWDNAITHLRNVIKTNANDITAFDCLADAYYSRGSYTSALRAYNKVMIMDPRKSSHCLTKIGYIHSLLTQYDDSIDTFNKVLKIDPNSFIALKGVAETWMRVAKKKIAAKLYGSSRDCAQKAIDNILKALKKQNQYICFWKLLADTLMFIIKLPNQYAYVDMPNLSSNKPTENLRKEKIDIFPEAIACYSHIAKQKQEIASYNLAYAYYCYYNESKDIVNAHIAYSLATVCIKQKPNYWRNWNLLGKICLLIKKYQLAQHCFIKALSSTRKFYLAKIWCNLGALYLKLNLYKLANYCFWRGQSILPSYPQSWIGQALIAEAIREDEAMDLFRHASRLGYHPESALGYADWVCRTLKNNKYSKDSELKYVIEGLHAIPYAMDLIQWFRNFEPNNACANNILGILQERSGQFMPAIKSYERAFKYAEDKNKNIIFMNIGRILLRLERYEEAVKIYKSIDVASFENTIGLALALFKNGAYQESYSVYDTALQWLSNDENEKADLLVAMSGIVYMYKGIEDAKTILLQSISITTKPTPYALYAITALCLLHSEQSASKVALKELGKFALDPKHGFDIGFLKSYYYILEDEVDEAIKVLSDSLHDYPSHPLLWYCMAQYCLRVPDSMAKAASCCAQKALCSAKFGDTNSKLGSILASASIAEFIAGDSKRGLILAKEGLHIYPNQAEIWAALLFSLLSEKLWMERKSWLVAAAGHMRRHLDISRSLSRWVSLLEKKLSR